MLKEIKSDAGKSVAEGGGRMFEPQPMVWEKMENFSGVLTQDTIKSYLKRVNP